MGLEVTWGKLLIEFMGGIATKASGIHDGKLWSDSYVADGMVDPLEGWC